MANEVRLIDANAIKYYDHMECYGAGIYRNNPIAYKDDIDEMPTVDAVEVVHAQWKVECKNRHKCSNCGFGRNTDTQMGWNFCPQCGADMRGDENERS